MADFNYSAVTNAGLELISKSTELGHKITFTAIRSGSGVYSQEEKSDEALRTMTDLKTRQQTAGIGTRMRAGTTLTLGTNFNNTGLATGYDMTEIGLYAVDSSDEGAQEILYAIAVTDTPSYMPAADPDAPTVITIGFDVAVTNDLHYTVIISQEVYAVASEVYNQLLLKVGFEDEATEADINAIIAGEYDPTDPSADDTGQIDEDGSVITEATDEEVQEVIDSLFAD